MSFGYSFTPVTTDEGVRITSLADLADHIRAKTQRSSSSFATALTQLAEDLRQIAIDRILSGRTTYSIKESTAEKKGHSTTFLDTGFYAKNIRVSTRSRGKKRLGKGSMSGPRTVFIEIMPDKSKIHPKSKNKTLHDIVAMLEFGTSDMRARPFWNDVMQTEAQAAIRRLGVDARGGIVYKNVKRRFDYG